MAFIYDKTMDRRQFIKTAGSAFGAITVVTILPGFLRGGPDASLRLALLSDTHIPEDTEESYRGFYPYRNLQKVAPMVAQRAPDGLVISGDLARLEGKPGDYRNLKSLLEPVAAKAPIYLGLGNHDNRDNFLEAFTDRDGTEPEVNGKHVVIFQSPDLRFIVLDSLLYTNRTAGLLGKAQRTWLESYLQGADNTPIVFFVHHTLGDGDSALLDVDRLFRIIQPYSQVKAIIYGHSHVYSITRRQRVQLINVPAVGYNFSDEEPVGWIEAEFAGSGVSLRLHAVTGNTANDGQVTEVAWL